MGSTSFTSTGGWGDFMLPSAGNNYFTGAYQIRTPTTGDVTFAGGSLSLDSQGGMLFKGPGIVTINNLILNGGSIVHGSTGVAAELATLTGAINVAADSILEASGGRTLVINSLFSGVGGLTVTGGGGTISLTNGGNTFSGPVTLTNSTVLNVSSIANGGIASALGNSSSSASNLVFNGGVLRVSASMESSTDRLLTLAGNGTLQSSGTAAVTFSSADAVAFSGEGDRTFTLGGSNTGFNIFAPKLTDNPEGGITSLTKNDGGLWYVTNTNTYTGATTVNGGTLVFSNLDNLGSGTAINMGGGTLRWDYGNTADITTRTVTLTGNTSGFDTFGQDVTLANAITGAGSLRKYGGGILTLSGDNTFRGNVTVENNSGGIRITNSNALGVGPKTIRVVGNQGTVNAPHLRLDGSQGSIVLPGSMSFVTSNDGKNGAGTPAAIINEAGHNSINGNVTVIIGGGSTNFQVDDGSLALNGNFTPNTGGRFVILSGAGNGTVNGILQNQPDTTNILGVTKEGTGTWVLNGANTYTAATSVLGGTLITNTASTGGGTVTVADGATFGVKVATPGQSFATSNLTVGSTTGAELLFDLGATGNPTAPLISAATLNLNGGITVDVSGSNLSVGTFQLLSYTTLNDASTALTLGALPTRTTATLATNATTSTIDLTVTAFDYPRWTGAQSTNWDVDNGTGTGTQNWQEVNSGNATRYLQGSNGNDSVLFDDTAAADKTTINLTSTLTPAYVTVNNSTLTYTFQGAGKLSGNTTLLKEGTGTLILANSGANDYSGMTKINAGTLQVGDGVTAGVGQLGTGGVINNGTLTFKRPDDFTVSNTIGGTGTMRHEGPGTLNAAGNLTGGLNVVQDGTGVLFLNGNNSFSGSVTVNSGTLRLGHGNALGSTAGGTTIASGAMLDLNGVLLPVGEVVTISGSGIDGAGALVNNGPSSYLFGLKNLTLAGDATIGGTGRWDIRENTGGLIGGGFKLTKVGSNEIAFRGLGETNLGEIQIDEGLLRIELSTLLGDPSKAITVNSGGTLDFWDSAPAHDKKVILNGGRLVVGSGTGTLLGSVTMNTAETTFDSGNTLILHGVVEGNSNITKSGSGTLELGGAASNTYTGTTTVTSGTLRLSKTDGATAITGDVTVNGGTLALGAANQFAADTSVTINGGTWSNGSSHAQTLKNLTINTGTLQTINSVNVTDTLSLTQGAHDLNSGRSLTAHTLSISGGANLRLGANGSDSTVNIGAGGLILDSGTLQLGQSGGTAAATVNLNGDLKASGYSFITNPNTSGPRIIDLQGGMRTFDVTDEMDMASISPTIQNGGITKTGAGILELTGMSTYTGDTVIQQGTLALSGSIAASANIDVRSGASLDLVNLFDSFAVAPGQTLKGGGDVMGAVRVDGTLAPGSDAIGELTFDSSLTLAGNAQFEINKTGLSLSADLATSSSLITFGGTLAVTSLGSTLSLGDTFQLFSAPSYAGSFTAFALPALESGLFWDTENLAVNGTLSVVPEPASVGLLFAGAGALLGMRRPRRRK